MTANVQTRMFSDDAWTPPTICQVLSEQQINCSRRSDRWRESSAGHSLHALRLRRSARLATWIFMIDRLWSWCRPYKSHSDLNSQPKQPGDLWPFDPESGVRVTCDVGYLCANFGLLRPLCSQLRPDVCDKHQTDRHQTKASLNVPPISGGA